MSSVTLLPQFAHSTDTYRRSLSGITNCFCMGAIVFPYLAFLALRLTPPSLRGFGVATVSLNVVGGVAISFRNTVSNLSLSTVISLVN